MFVCHGRYEEVYPIWPFNVIGRCSTLWNLFLPVILISTLITYSLLAIWHYCVSIYPPKLIGNCKLTLSLDVLLIIGLWYSFCGFLTKINDHTAVIREVKGLLKLI